MTTHTFRKKLGQNFLRDTNLMKIMRCVNPLPNHRFLKIDPSESALTEKLVIAAF